MMAPVKFDECNVVLCENDPDYKPLPILRQQSADGVEVISCWKLSLVDRIKVLFTGRVWVDVFTAKGSPQPIILSADKDDIIWK